MLDRPARSSVAIPTELPGPNWVYITLTNILMHIIEVAAAYFGNLINDTRTLCCTKWDEMGHGLD